ncbi:MAG: hypothetical protein Q9187_000649 [Circinaria calcarea]
MSLFSICIIVPKPSVNSVKKALEAQRKLDKARKIESISNAECLLEYVTETGYRYDGRGFLVRTTETVKVTDESTAQAMLDSERDSLARKLGIELYAPMVSFAVYPWELDSTLSALPGWDTPAKGRLAQLITHWLLDLPSELRSSLPTPVTQLVSILPASYTIYPPLLLLPPPAFTRPPWPKLLDTILKPYLLALYLLLCQTLHVTHIARNAPIPLLSTSTEANPSPNILRAPIALTRLHGDFGPPGLLPSPSAFTAAFWVSTRQHSIYQTWAPLYTMFSRGNISEKARILAMPELSTERLGYEPAESSAVDLYAGIGYFAFCYAKRGVGRVFCWEISGWSVEGLRRGAEGNGWRIRMVEGEERCEGSREKLVVFAEDNRRAGERMRSMRGRIPPVRHVNCGFLPSSEGSWETAVDVLDPVEGGWVHAHENIAIEDIEARRDQIVKLFERLLIEHGAKPHRTVECQHLEKVKSYAPGVMHCVLDIYIGPALQSTRSTVTTPKPGS